MSDTIPCPPPDDDDWEEITAVESPRALTPIPGDLKPKPRSGEWLLHDRVGKDPPGVRPARAVRTAMPGYPPRLPKDAGRGR